MNPRKKIIREIVYIVLSISILILLVFYHKYALVSDMDEYNRQKEEIAKLEEMRDEALRKNQTLNYRKKLLEHDEDLFYETILREDYGIKFENEEVYSLQ